jgi:NosR/NirI family transcriptional regulator, nitrous oxide reductase regulator
MTVVAPSALTLGIQSPLRQWWSSLWSGRSEASYPDLPVVAADGATNVPGLFVIGELAGAPLLKLGLNAGVQFIHHHRDALRVPVAAGTHPLVIIGAGAAGLAAAMKAKEEGIDAVVLEAKEVAQTVVSMHRAKVLYAEPLGVRNQSSLWFQQCTREELLLKWQQQLAEAGIVVRCQSPVVSIRRSDHGLHIELGNGEVLHARAVVVAIGKSGPSRRSGATGQDAHRHKVHHGLADASDVRGQRVFVYGGGDSACELAMALAPHNQVTLCARHDFSASSPRSIAAIDKASKAGQLQLLQGTLDEIRADEVVLGALPSGPPKTIGNDLVFEMLGNDPPKRLLQAMGVRLQSDWPWQRFVAAALVFVAVYSLYAFKKYPELPFSWPFASLLAEDDVRRGVGAVFDLAFAPFKWVFTVDALADIKQTLWFQQGYLYSLGYTLVMIVFGAEALLRWSRIAKDPRMQRARYASLVTFQVLFFLLANVVAVQGLSIQHSWRAWGLYQPWPLFFHTFNWWSDSDPMVIKVAFIGAGLLGTFVVIPVLSRRHGKRFCTWVCGCGGLAETLGDRWRHLAPKGGQSRAWEFQSFIVLGAVTLITLITVGMYETRADNAWATAYSYIVDFWLVAVIPIAAYPFFGGKVWCRYWCPLAAYNQLLSKWYGRLQISSNDQCIRCGECSKHCQVGVDVMSFARRQQSFDNTNSSCIHCGICVDVCPVDVLQLSLKPTSRALPVVS